METETLALQSPAGARPDRPSLLYDDGCRFCRAMAELLFRLARPRDLAVLPWAAPAAQQWLAALPPEIRDASMHLKRPDGVLVSGDEVFAATLLHVRGLRWVARLAEELPLAASLLRWQYRVVAGHRELFSRFVPDRPAVSREPRLR